MSPPLVAVVADVRPADGYVWHAAAQTYLDAVIEGARAVPVIVPSRPGLDVAGLMARVDGVLATGARSNVHPARYGTEETEAHAPFDRARDEASLGLIEAAIEAGRPLLALCRGFQELNVVRGGTLHAALHEVAGRMDHRAPASDDQDVRFAPAHEATPVEGGRLADLVGVGPIRVNSLHRQGIAALGRGLRIEATAPDGTIEAIGVADARAFALGVQWHPEYLVRTDAPSRAIFEAFGAAMRA